ncbi:MAG: inorganic phosphate transporter [Alphaproteobacteria bacterium]|nr:inorganic phosphate transporter [Alphaproteobacteria bacterium]
MEISVLFYLSSGLFLGWALGANQLGNIFGTALGTHMVSFKKAAFLTSLCLILGAFFSASGTAETMAGLGQVKGLAGAFTIAFSAAVALFMMTKAGIPVSSTQAIVGSFLGWNLYNQFSLPTLVMSKIFIAWILSPFLAGMMAFLLMKALRFYLYKRPIPILYVDAYLRLGLLIVGMFAAYAVGANNIPNVMGPFLFANPFQKFVLFGYEISPLQQLFFLGASAMAVGVYTFSKRVVQTIGGDLLKMTSLDAFVIVASQGIVLFLFSSVSLQQFLLKMNLPTFPLVPVSNSEAIIGAIIGVSLSKGTKGLKYKEVLRIMRGWIISPFVAMILCFVALFFMANVFQLSV